MLAAEPSPSDIDPPGKWKERWQSVRRKLSNMGLVSSSQRRGKRSTAPEAETEYGAVRGMFYRDKHDLTYKVFLGVPFAKPPVGHLRFEKPERPQPWHDEVLETTKYRCRAIQRDFVWDMLELGVGKSEDCLYLNIMAPSWEAPAEGWPVIIYIHGGGFLMDSAVKYPYTKICKHLCSKEVIVVTIQYRLGIFGFLSTDDDNAKGNYGMWDQTMALAFVKDNIAAFSGNPENITIMGHSAGAAACDLLSLSPHSRDLFSKMIVMGGSAETIWSMSARSRVARHCRAKAIELGFTKRSSGERWTFDDNRRLVRFLRKVPADKMGMTLIGMRSTFESMQMPVSPVIDGDFFPKSLNELRAEAPPKIVISGNCEYEGLLFLSLGMREANKDLLDFIKNRVSHLVDEANRLVPASEQLSTEQWEDIYRLRRPMDKVEIAHATVQMIGDLANGIGMFNLSKKLLANGSTVYNYNFKHCNPAALSLLFVFMPFYGATHGSECNSIFQINMFIAPYPRTAADRQMTQVITTYFTNFAKYGNPNGSDSMTSSDSSESPAPLLTPSTSTDSDATTDDIELISEVESSTKHLTTWLPTTEDDPNRFLVMDVNSYMQNDRVHTRYEHVAQLFDHLHEMITLASDERYAAFAARVKEDLPS